MIFHKKINKHQIIIKTRDFLHVTVCIVSENYRSFRDFRPFSILMKEEQHPPKRYLSTEIHVTIIAEDHNLNRSNNHGESLKKYTQDCFLTE
jgi:hypothetical protein